ncbi:hypothetical protein GE061_018708 [Apolygus lucorum]|uniref:Dehydrogenase/reductase SDR family member 11 n=1 Tax=Apolygus lucorum TaxID=248454 RepID=A0A8S9X878_APOLU|nr:hypothetical protein GE061_018708 [Apolygus lucorum]
MECMYKQQFGELCSNYAPFHFYTATKHAAKAIAEGLRQELRNIEVPIRVTSISPGLVKTNIFKSSLGDKMDANIYDKHPCITPEDVATSIQYILGTPQHVNINEIAISPTGADYNPTLDALNIESKCEEH